MNRSMFYVMHSHVVALSQRLSQSRTSNTQSASISAASFAETPSVQHHILKTRKHPKVNQVLKVLDYFFKRSLISLIFNEIMHVLLSNI